MQSEYHQYMFFMHKINGIVIVTHMYSTFVMGVYRIQVRVLCKIKCLHTCGIYVQYYHVEGVSGCMVYLSCTCVGENSWVEAAH